MGADVRWNVSFTKLNYVECGVKTRMMKVVLFAMSFRLAIVRCKEYFGRVSTLKPTNDDNKKKESNKVYFGQQ